MPAKEPSAEESIQLEIISVISKQRDLENQEHELMQDPRFANYLKAQKEFKTQSELFWEAIKNSMIASGIKSVKGEWGSITVAERTTFEVDETKLAKILNDDGAKKYFKEVPDVKKIGDDYKLKGKAPKGASPKVTQYLTKRIK